MRNFAIVPNTMKYSVQQPLMLVRINDKGGYEKYDKFADRWVADGSLTRYFNGGDNDADEITVAQADAAVKYYKEQVANMLPEQKAKIEQRRAQIQGMLDKLRPIEEDGGAPAEATPEVTPEEEKPASEQNESDNSDIGVSKEEEKPEEEDPKKKKPIMAKVVKE